MPSEYRGLTDHQQLNNNQITTMAHTTTNASTTYAQATNRILEYTYPPDENAIIIDTIDQSEIRDYLVAISKFVCKTKIIATSRISRNRICIYFSEETIADELIKKTPCITINNHKLPIRKLITNARRVTISDVPPSITNDQLQAEFEKNKLKVLSQIIILKTLSRDEEFGHILSFRRQATIQPLEENAEIPDSLLISRGTRAHRIFLSRDDVRCEQCGAMGHTSNKCKKQVPQTQLADLPDITTSQTSRKRTLNPRTSESSASSDVQIIATDHVQSSQTPQNQQVEISQDTDKTLHESTVNKDEDKPKKKIRRRKKKKKIDTTPLSMEEQLEPLKKILEAHSNIFQITYEGLKNFMEATMGANNETIKKLIEDSNIEPLGLAEILRSLYKELEYRQIKARFTKIINIIIEDGQNNEGANSETNLLLEDISEDLFETYDSEDTTQDDSTIQ